MKQFDVNSGNRIRLEIVDHTFRPVPLRHVLLKGPVGIFCKRDYIAHVQTRSNNSPRAHSWKIEFPSQMLTLSSLWGGSSGLCIRENRGRLVPRESQDKDFSSRQPVEESARSISTVVLRRTESPPLFTYPTRATGLFIFSHFFLPSILHFSPFFLIPAIFYPRLQIIYVVYVKTSRGNSNFFLLMRSCCVRCIVQNFISTRLVNYCQF